MSLQLFVLAAIAVALANGHGYMKEPIARTSIQLRPEFGTQQPYWWDNQGVWCGNVQQDTSYSTCGRCGDRQGETTANQGGIYDKGVIVATYQSGAVSLIRMLPVPVVFAVVGRDFKYLRISRTDDRNRV